MQHSNSAAGYMKLLENANSQLKEVNAALERRLASADALIRQLRAQPREDPSMPLNDIRDYIQKLCDAQERKKRRTNRTVSVAEPSSGGEAATATGGGGGAAAE